MSKNIDMNRINQPIASGRNAKWSYVSLLFSLFYFFPLVVIAPTQSVGHLFLIISIYALFLVAFFMSAGRCGKAALLPILSMIAVAVVGTFVYAGTNVFYGYSSYFASYYFKTKQAFALLIVNLICQLGVAYQVDILSIYFLGPSILVTLSLHIYGFFSRKEVLNQLFHQEQNKQIESLAAVAERERIARDMHDLLGHSLSSLALKSELAEKYIEREHLDQAKREIHQVAELSRDTLSEVRQAVTGLKLQSLQTGIGNLSEQLTHLGFKSKLSIHLDKLPEPVETTLYLLSKEWVTNILRHSNGGQVAISLSNDANKVKLEIRDNGRVKAITPGNGIWGMQQRVLAHSGQLEITTHSDVVLTVTLPLN